MGPYAARGMPLDVFYLSLVTIAFAQALPMSVCSGLLVESQGHTFQEYLNALLPPMIIFCCSACSLLLHPCKLLMDPFSPAKLHDHPCKLLLALPTLFLNHKARCIFRIVGGSSRAPRVAQSSQEGLRRCQGIPPCCLKVLVGLIPLPRLSLGALELPSKISYRNL